MKLIAHIYFWSFSAHVTALVGSLLRAMGDHKYHQCFLAHPPSMSPTLIKRCWVHNFIRSFT